MVGLLSFSVLAEGNFIVEIFALALVGKFIANVVARYNNFNKEACPWARFITIIPSFDIICSRSLVVASFVPFHVSEFMSE